MSVLGGCWTNRSGPAPGPGTEEEPQLPDAGLHGRHDTRPLGPAELPAYGQLAAYAYNQRPEDMVGWVESYPTVRLLGLYEKGELGAALMDLRFEVWLDGRLVPGSGIGGVASAPETRRRGLVRALLAAHLEELNEEGVVLSMLYPFKFSFYHRFGWGYAARCVEARMAPSQFAEYGRPVGRVRRLLYADKGGVQPLAGETMDSLIAKLNPIYEVGASAYNLGVRRRREQWGQAFQMRAGRRHVFAWDAGDGEVKGYLMLRVPDERDHTDLIVREIFALTPDAWRGLFWFLANHDSQNNSIMATLPVEHPLLGLLADPRTVTFGRFGTGAGPMARVVNVERLLAVKATGVAAGPAAEVGAAPDAGRRVPGCSIRVRDELAPWNDGVFAVRCEGDKVTVTKGVGLPENSGGATAATGAVADLSLDIDAFSRLAAGAATVADLAAFGLAEVRPGPGLEFAAGLFPTRPIWHVEYY